MKSSNGLSRHSVGADCTLTEEELPNQTYKRFVYNTNILDLLYRNVAESASHNMQPFKVEQVK